MEISFNAVAQAFHFLKEHMDAVGGAFVSFLVAQDYSLGRFIAGIASGLFCAVYFTDWLLYYLPIPHGMSTTDAHTVAGALWGLTGYVVVSTVLILVQQKTTEYLSKSVDNAEGKEV